MSYPVLNDKDRDQINSCVLNYMHAKEQYDKALEERKKMVLYCYDNGMSVAHIAREFSLPYQNVQGILKSRKDK